VIGLPASRIVGLVDRLETKGWILRATGRHDQRTNALELAPAGRAVLEQIIAVGAEHEAELTRGLEPDERAELLRLLHKVSGTAKEPPASLSASAPPRNRSRA
jgi:DNA-binding MarR family transcriptional regulator